MFSFGHDKRTYMFLFVNRWTKRSRRKCWWSKFILLVCL